MSDAITIETSHQLIKHTRASIEPGDYVDSWCNIHKERTRHLWTGYKLICLVCHPELEPREEGENG